MAKKVLAAELLISQRQHEPLNPPQEADPADDLGRSSKVTPRLAQLYTALWLHLFRR